MGHKYLDHDLIDLDDENEKKRKNEGFGERPQDSYSYIHHDMIDLDDDEDEE